MLADACFVALNFPNMIPEIKICTKCKIAKGFSEFRWRTSKKQKAYLNPSCKECERKYSRNSNMASKSPEYRKEQRKKYKNKSAEYRKSYQQKYGKLLYARAIERRTEIGTPKERICKKCNISKQSDKFYTDKINGIRFICIECTRIPKYISKCVICNLNIETNRNKKYCSKKCFMSRYNILYQNINKEAIKEQRRYYYLKFKSVLNAKSRLNAYKYLHIKRVRNKEKYYSDVHKSRIQGRLKQKKYSDNLTDSYVISTIVKRTNIPRTKIREYKDFIKAKRIELQIKRKIRNEKTNELSATC